MKWMYKINVKEFFEDETTPELVYKLSKILFTHLQKIKDSLESKSDYDESCNEYYLVNNCADLLMNFSFLMSLTGIDENDKIDESEFEDYGFDGNFENIFNDYLSQLYDLGDYEFTDKKGKQHRFIWVG